jgi:adenine C2-methylase RlmN of 23S rRNA A2503 and tRNA A37
MAEAIACVKKYFNEASEDIKLFVLIIKGINDNKLISSPIQAPNQEFAEIVIKVPLIRVNINSNFDEFLKIKKKRIETFINGV